MKALATACVGAAILAFAASRLPAYHQALFAAGWQPSFWEVLPMTLDATLRVWAFWGLATLVLATALLRRWPALGRCDALLAGGLGVCVVAYMLGLTLGQVGLLRPWVVRGILAGGLGATVRHMPLLLARPRLTFGGGLVLLAAVLVLPGIGMLQLGSPVPPHFDVMSPIAAAQRIVTFGLYLPWDSDAYGYYGPVQAQPALELFYAVLTLGAGVPLATLAVTAATVPLALLLLVGTYRLGASLAGDLAGGFAALLLSATTMWRNLPTGHGRYVAFVFVAVGLALVCDARRFRPRLVLGALLLGVAVSVHAVIGAFGMTTVAITCGIWLLADDWCRVAAGLTLLLGATLVALPSVAVNLSFVVPAPLLPIAPALGLVVASYAVMPNHPPRECRTIVALGMLMILGIAVLCPTLLPIAYVQWVVWRSPLLWGLGLVGILAAIPAPVLRAPILAAVLVGCLADHVGSCWHTAVADPTIDVAIHDFAYKAEFWYRFALVFPAAVTATAVASVVPRACVTLAVLAALVIPLQYGRVSPIADPNYDQISVVELWAEQVNLTARGYWSPRLAQTPTQTALYDVLREEIAAGRITPATHIVHLKPIVYPYENMLLHSVFVGVADALYVDGWVLDRSTAQGRYRPLDEARVAIAAKPAYVTIHERTFSGHELPAGFVSSLPLQEYDTLLEGEGVRLLRRKEIG